MSRLMTAEADGSTTARSGATVYWCAAVGAAFLAFELYLYVRWITGGNVKPNTRGSTAAPGWMTAAVDVHIALGIVTLIGCIWWFLVRPWQQGRRVTSDGLLMLACMTCFWGDLAANYFRYAVVYPTTWPNIGSWYNFIPGWHSPRGNLQAEPIVFFLPMYAVCMFGFTGIACAAMRRVQARRPQTGKLQLFLVSWVLMAIVDLVLELLWVRLHLFVYPSTIRSLTLFPGHIYQFPVYESVCWGCGWAWLSVVRFWRNEHDETIVEHGLSSDPGSTRRKLVLRFLALCAAANIGLLGYNVAFSLISREGARWPADFTSRPYITGGLCGPGASYSCRPPPGS
jgi:hypothetical protein